MPLDLTRAPGPMQALRLLHGDHPGVPGLVAVYGVALAAALLAGPDPVGAVLWADVAGGVVANQDTSTRAFYRGGPAWVRPTFVAVHAAHVAVYAALVAGDTHIAAVGGAAVLVVALVVLILPTQAAARAFAAGVAAIALVASPLLPAFVVALYIKLVFGFALGVRAG